MIIYPPPQHALDGYPNTLYTDTQLSLACCGWLCSLLTLLECYSSTNSTALDGYPDTLYVDTQLPLAVGVMRTHYLLLCISTYPLTLMQRYSAY